MLPTYQYMEYWILCFTRFVASCHFLRSNFFVRTTFCGGQITRVSQSEVFVVRYDAPLIWTYICKYIQLGP
ncbi:hypothetical protein XELAEV_18011835mg [Xenopus laevis]|uniref:Uncharacterized protein n=1 Tax=Xenopus laevis TaxID=8355 RepID=A0A974DLH5_XENLA|nr:hypothetical protein XELAEV_18011835mg [Xenopus laevis]